jgi:aromatic ring hydroxylase
MIRTGREYIESLRDGRELYLGDEEVKDVTTHPKFRPTIESIASCYDLTCNRRDEFTFEEVGEVFSTLWLIPKSKHDFVKIRKHIMAWHEETAGCLGRLHDYLCVWVWALYIQRHIFAKGDRSFANNVVRYYHYCRSNDIALTHAISTPQIDRSPGARRRDNEDLHVVDANERGVIVEGAKIVSTYIPYANELINLPALPANPDEDPNYIIGFAIPLNAKNLKIVCRVSYVDPDNPHDYPLTTMYDDMDAMVIFDRVLIPWERVFIYGEKGPQINYEIFNDVLGFALWEAAVKNVVKSRYLIGLALMLTSTFGTDAYPNVQEKIGWMIEYHNVLQAAIEGAEDMAKEVNGALVPNIWVTWPLVQLFSNDFYPKMVETLRTLSGSGIVMHPPMRAFNNLKIRPYLERYFRAKGANAIDRLQILKFIADYTINSYGGRMLQYEKYYAADPFRVAIVHFRYYPEKDKFIELARSQIEKFRARYGVLPT